jgi:hypothetical protein
MQNVLSEVPGLGRVMMCGNCDEVHVAVGRSSFRIPQEMFSALAGMFSRAAAALSPAEAAAYKLVFKDGVPSFAPLKES